MFTHCFNILLLPFFFLTEVSLIYNVVLGSGVQQSDLDIYIYVCFYRLISITGYYKILNTVSCAIQ